MEEWREIPDTDYRVSNEGRVASRKYGDWRVLKPGMNSAGYLLAVLCVNGTRRNRHVHTLVAEAFLGPRPTPGHEVNHIDGIRVNNLVENLEWVTGSENQRHRIDVLGHNNTRRGEAHGFAKLTDNLVRAVRTRYANGETQGRIAADLGVCQSSVSKIVNRENWGWLD